MPKQFLRLIDNEKTMLQLTVERILPLLDLEDIFIATNRDYEELVFRQLPGLPKENVLCEPVGKNTAPCIGLGAVNMAEKYGDVVMITLPSDQLIKHKEILINTLKEACEAAEAGNNLVTLGVPPDCPETGYGYIKFQPHRTFHHAFAVEQFVEKPDLETAKEYLASEQYLWNSGIFVWKVSTILNALEQYLPDTYSGLCRIRQALGTENAGQVLEKEFQLFLSESIDYGVMEKAPNIYTLAGAFGWDDVGSWLSVGRLKKSNEFGNVVDGKTVMVETRDSIIQGGERLIAAVGLENVIIVDTPDALLICNKNHVGGIKKVLENLKICSHTEYL